MRDASSNLFTRLVDRSTAKADLRRAIGSLRARKLGLGFVEAISAAALAAFVVVSASMAADAMVGFSEGTRWTLLLFATATAGVLLARQFTRACRAATALRLADAADRRDPSRSTLKSAVGLMTNSARPNEKPLTSGLRELALIQSSEAARSVQPVAVFTADAVRRPLRRLLVASFLAVAIAVAMPRLVGTELLRFLDPRGDHPPFSTLTFNVRPGVADIAVGDGIAVVARLSERVEGVELFTRDAQGVEQRSPMFHRNDGHWTATLADLRQPIDYWVSARGARSHRQAVRIKTAPTIRAIEFTVTPPAYTRLPSASHRGTATSITALVGSRVDVRVVGDRPLNGGTIAGIASAPLARSNEPAVVLGGFVVERQGLLSISVIATDGVLCHEPISCAVVITPDRAPTVQMMSPPTVSYATPDATIDVVVEAEDDLGVGRLELLRSLNGSVPMPVKLNTTTRPSIVSRSPFAISGLGLRAGDTLRLSAHAVDENPRGPSQDESDTHVIHIVDRATLNDIIRRAEDEAARRASPGTIRERLDAISERIENAQRPEDLSESIDQLRQMSSSLSSSPSAVDESHTGSPDAGAARELAGRIDRVADGLQRVTGDARGERIAASAELSSAAASYERDAQRGTDPVGIFGIQREVTGPTTTPSDRVPGAPHNPDSSHSDRVPTSQSFQQQWNIAAAGAADAPVSAEFREDVNAYYRRVLDELSGAPR